MRIHTRPHGKWKYELDFRFMAGDDGEDPVEVGKKAAAEIRLLTAKLEDTEIKMDLEGVAEAFEDTVDSVKKDNRGPYVHDARTGYDDSMSPYEIVKLLNKYNDNLKEKQ